MTLDSPPKSSSLENSPNLTLTPQHLFTELPTTKDIELVQPDTWFNVAPNHGDNLEEIQPLPDSTEVQLQQMLNDIDDLNKKLDIIPTTLPNCVTTNNADGQLAINNLSNCVTNHENWKIIHSAEKETPVNNHSVINRGKQSVARSMETNYFSTNLDQQKITHTDIPTDNNPTPANDSNIYLMQQVKKHRHRNEKLEFLIKWLDFLKRYNTWEPENHFPPALVQEYFQKSKLEQSIPTNAVCMTKILKKETWITYRCYIPRPLVLICLLALRSLFAKAQPTSITALHLGPLYDCSQLPHLEIIAFSSLANCSHNIYSKTSPYRHSESKSFDILPLQPFS